MTNSSQVYSGLQSALYSGNVGFDEHNEQIKILARTGPRFALRQVSEGFFDCLPDLETAVEQGSISADEMRLAIHNGKTINAPLAQHSLRLVRTGDVHYAPFLQKMVRDGYLDQEDVHLAIIEGKKECKRRLRNKVDYLLANARRGWDMYIPKLMDLVKEGVVDEGIALKSIIEGRKK